MSLPDNLNPALQDLPVYQPGRPLEEVAREVGLPSEQIIKLASNENPFGPSPYAVTAMEELATEMHRYPDGNACSLRNQLAEKLGVETENLVFGNGSNEIIEFVAHSLLKPGDDIVVSEYCFAIYPIVAKMMGAKIVQTPAKQYGHDLSSMLKAVTADTKIIFVANPNNPTGTSASKTEIYNLITRLPSDILLVLDEAYIEYQKDPIDLLDLVRSGEYPNLILMRTFSKIYGLAGLRIGYGVGHPEFVGALEKIRQPFNINAMAQKAAMAALSDESHIEMSRAQNTRGSIHIESELDDAGIEYLHTLANFILIRVGNGSQVAEKLKQLGIIVRPLDNYGLQEWIRVTIGSENENKSFLSAIRQVLTEHKE